MSDKDTYFLTEAVLLVTKGPLAGEDNEVVKDLKEFYQERGIHVEPSSEIIPVLELYSIHLQYNDPAYPRTGTFDPAHYLDWIEARRQGCERRGWLAKGIIKYGGNYQMRLLEEPYLPINLMELICELTDSPSGTTLDKIIIDKNKSGIIYPEIQIPFISWLNKNELNRISARLKDLSPNKTNPAIKPLWEFTDLARQVIEAWYIRNNLEIPKIEYPGIKLTDWDRFVELIREALAVGPQTDEQLWGWKRRFAELPAYFKRYGERYNPLKWGPGSGNGLEWRDNPNFRKPRTKTSAM